MCVGLVGPKSENVEMSSVFACLLEGSREPRVKASEPWCLGGGRRRVDPPQKKTFVVLNKYCGLNNVGEGTHMVGGMGKQPVCLYMPKSHEASADIVRFAIPAEANMRSK